MEREITGQTGRDKNGLFLTGHPGMGGRPKGSLSIKDLVRQHLEDNPHELKRFVEHFIQKNRELAWQMLEGRPAQDLNAKAEIKVTPIFNGLSKHDSDQTDFLPKEEN